MPSKHHKWKRSKREEVNSPKSGSSFVVVVVVVASSRRPIGETSSILVKYGFSLHPLTLVLCSFPERS